MADRCPWKIKWGVSEHQIAACRKDGHLISYHDGEAGTDPEHEGYAGNGITIIHWYSGDRREFTGDWPGPCIKGPCTLPAGHHGRCAP